MKNCFNVFSLSILLYGSLVLPVYGQHDDGEKWSDLFNGRNFKGWVQLGGDANFRIENGEMVGTSKTSTPSSFMVTNRHYGDFVLEFELKIDTAMNSGVQFRSNSLAEFKEGRVHGYQLEIDPSPRAWTGGIYDEGRRGWLFNLADNEVARKAFKNGEWNHYRIEAIGPVIKTWVNGVPAADLRDDMTTSGFIGLQVHSTKNPRLMEVRWRGIRISDR